MIRRVVKGLHPADLEKIPGVQFKKGEAFLTYDQEAILHRRKVLTTLEPLEVDHRRRADMTGAPKDAYEFQLQGLMWVQMQCLGTGSALLADDMGLGKTMQALHAAEKLAKPDGTIVICCPRSVALTWKAEIKKWFGADAFVVKSAKQAAKAEGRYVITSYDLADAVDLVPEVVVLDEAHQLRGRNTKRSKRIRQLCALASYRIGLTGTPIWDRPRDFWQLLDILWPGRFGSRFDFDVAYCNGKLNEWGGLENKGATLTDELRLRLESHLMLRRTREQVKLQLPTLQRQVVWLEADEKASAAFRRSAVARAPGDLFKALEATLAAKIEPCVSEALSCDRCLVFTWTRAHATEIHRRLVAEGHRAVLIHGGMTAQLRSLHVQQAVKEKCSVVATVDSTGTGVDGLQHVSHIGIFHALDWRPLQLAQAEARLARIGQSQGVLWKYLALKDSADEAVMHTIVSKLDQARAVLGTGSNEALRNDLSDSRGGSDEDILKSIYENYSES